MEKITREDLLEPAAADGDWDGAVTSADARLILQRVAEQITDWP